MGRGREASQSSAIVPDSATEPVKRTLGNIKEFEANLLQCLSMADPDVVAEMEPLHRAELFLVLAKSATALLTLRLRCNGIQPDDHPIKTEIERLRLLEEKLDRYTTWNRAPIRPSTTINYQAATRFIDHSLPDLTPEQRKCMRAISRGKKVSEKNASRKKRKYQLSEQQSVRAAAAEFLEKAAKELLGSNTGGLKGPLRNEISDEENRQMA